MVSHYVSIYYAVVAQLVEHLIRNQGVTGSIPVDGTSLVGAVGERYSPLGCNPSYVGSSPTSTSKVFQPRRRR